MHEADEAATLEGEDEDEAEAREAQMGDTEFIIAELLRLAVNLDFTDEIGRRKMFTITREWGVRHD